ncbi:hypothetical protein [Zeaxanthinibacter enoshimensis]|uniref:Uncharacterized protein n=1 Tax=Zeaxanthinibacter enoshimensis TaxID=392009 RepID=A0A4R6TQK6_9FLAO|nr:hypothetical protein [Zeaxanthinibacter enoshimensis]TDQ32577.1 hypothetical protein CLV82_0410 [Zeaxanthinibacter enoshimensis]
MIDPVLIGPLKCFLLLAASALVYSLVHKRAVFSGKKDLRMRNAILMGSFLPFIVFVLFLFHLYDKFIILVIITGAILTPANFWNSRRISVAAQFRSWKRNTLLKIISIQQGGGKNYLQGLKDVFTVKKGWDAGILLMWIGAFITLFSRYHIRESDNYTLSELWLENLKMVRGINEGTWYIGNNIIPAELFLVNLYHRLTGIGEEMALHTFGLIENFLIAILLFWCVAKISASRYLIPFIAVLFYALAYPLLPINISLFLEHNSLNLAICLVLASLIFLIYPSTMYKNNRKYFGSLVLIFAATSIFHLFTALIVIPLILLCTVLFIKKRNLQYVGSAVLAWLTALFIISLVYAGICWTMHWSFYEFIMKEMITVNAYQDLSHLWVPVDDLFNLYRWLFYITLFLLAVIWWKKKYIPRALLISATASIIMIALPSQELQFLDQAMLFQLTSIFLVLAGASFLGAIQQLTPKPERSQGMLYPLGLGVMGLIVMFASIFTLPVEKSTHHTLNKELLGVYEDLSTSHLPFTYAVVNANYGLNLSISEHHFISYSSFLDGYKEKDSLYYHYRSDTKYLKNNPGLILPESVFVIITDSSDENYSDRLMTSKVDRIAIEEILKELKNRGRTVREHFSGSYLKVFEIINTPRASEVQQMVIG